MCAQSQFLLLATTFVMLQNFFTVSAQSCPPIKSPMFGSAQCSGNQVNDRCVFQCDPGYALTATSANIRRCVCLDLINCFWNGADAACEPYSVNCPSPSLTGNTYTIIDIAPQGAVVKISVTPTKKANNGWSVIIIFTEAISDSTQVRSFSMLLSAISSDRKAVTFKNRGHNSDISSGKEYSFTILVESTSSDLSPGSLKALVGFYDSPVVDGSCFSDVNIAATTSPQITVTTTVRTPILPTTLPSPVLRTQPSQIPTGCQEIEYLIDNPGWNALNGWNFIFRYRAPVGSYENWIIKIEFSTNVSEITAYDSKAEGPYRDGKIWMLKPRSWNFATKNQQMDAIGMSVTSSRPAPTGYAILCNNGIDPGTTLMTELGSVQTTSPSDTTASSTVTVMSTQPNTLNPNGPSGILPSRPRQTIPQPKPSSIKGDYDFNEILHKAILFYEAQRSGMLPSNNRIPWRGDSALTDGCLNGVCDVDLTGGWYDAGDFMKFGFPMAWSVTVLAWGMVEFKTGYQDAGEWSNALSMLRWATDYLIKAHVSPNELYFQVGNPKRDHTKWGHPETMSMERPAYKIDTNNPGTEVAAETAAALAASSIVFKSINAAYANNLLSHAIQIYDFAQSYSGYNDELMWSAMWLYKATRNMRYLDDAIQQVNYVSVAEFSWDQKGPGAMVLLSQERSEYKSNLFSGLNFAMAKKKTPGGLVHFSDWGSNRYAANYALIALLAAKSEGVSSNLLGKRYYSFAKDQISRMLGQGDGKRSYVVGFGLNSPQQPHHRASSCRAWTADPFTQTCDWSDRDANRANPYVLYGALVGGPTSTGYYVDDRKSFVSNEVALDYNAGFQSAIAGLKYFQVSDVKL